jgi:hypothetical protein
VSRLIVYPTLDEYEARLPVMADRFTGLNADVLKKMARVWVGKEAYKLNKESAIKTLQGCFRDPKAIRRRKMEVEREAREYWWKRRVSGVTDWDMAKYLLAAGALPKPGSSGTALNDLAPDPYSDGAAKRSPSGVAPDPVKAGRNRANFTS